MSHAILLISCPDKKGITASVTEFVFRREGNILDADQHTDADAGMFFMRMTWELAGFSVTREKIAAEFQPIADHFEMNWELHFSDTPVRTAIFVSRHLHCLYDLLFRYQSGHLPGTVGLIVSNHREAEPLAKQWNIPFLYTPVFAETKLQAEETQLAALKEREIDLVVLARYHQILSADFLRSYPYNRIINIHHSFLPAFTGGSPYAQAYRKGVKIIGATSHYVIEDLDQGPIIEQDTIRVSHKHSIQDMQRLGQDLERVVLYRAVRWHLEYKILSCGNRTVVFE